MQIFEDGAPEPRRRPALLRILVAAAVAGAVLLLTPYFLFDRDGGFEFDAADVRAAVQGTWRIEVTPAQGPSRAITFTMDQARSSPRAERARSWIRPAAACDHRTLVRSAEACLDRTDMELTLIAAGGERALSPTAQLRVLGRTFERAHLELAVDGRTVRASISRTGAVLEAFADGATVSLARVDAPAAVP